MITVVDGNTPPQEITFMASSMFGGLYLTTKQ